MAKRSPAQRLEALKDQRARLDRQIKAVEAAERTRERKADTRRKILAGAAVLGRAEHDATFAAMLDRLLDDVLERPADRALFDLPERTGQAAPAPSPAGDTPTP